MFCFMNNTFQIQLLICIYEVICNKNVLDQWHLKIQEGKGLVVIVKPSCSSLNANEAVPVDVYVYANTWGVYYDQIICYVEGLQPFIIQLIVQVIGTPTAFVLRCANGTPQPTVR